MEFDTTIGLKEISRETITSDKDFDSFVRSIWDAASSEAHHVAEAGNGELWLDYSDLLRTKYLVVNVEESENGYSVRFRGGSKPGLAADVVIMLCILGLFWMAGKVLVPSPKIICILASVLFLAVAGSLYFYCGKAFGKKESAMLIKNI